MNLLFPILGKDKYTSPSMPCPRCDARKAKFVESLGLGVTRWRCGACRQTWRYIKAEAPPDMVDVRKNPSLAFGGPKVMRKHIDLRGLKFRGRIPIVGR